MNTINLKALQNLPKIISHQSIISNNYPGNSKEAIEESLTVDIKAIEVDIRLSKNNIPFLYHGDDLNEETNGEGKPEHHQWSDVKKLSYNDKNKSNLLSLEDLFKMIGSQKYIFLDMKLDRFFNQNMINEVVNLIHKYKLEGTVIVEFFNPLFLIATRIKSPDIILAYSFTTNITASPIESQEFFDKIPWILKQTFFQKQVARFVKPEILSARFNIDKTLITNFIDQGYNVVSWTIDDEDVAKDLFSLGIKAIQSNKAIKLSKCL